MPGAARLNDIGSGHACFPATPVVEGSQDVIINGQPAARQGDAIQLHGCPCPNMPHGLHPRQIAAGSSTVIINGKQAVRIGDDINCGGNIVTGSSNVIIGDTPYQSPVAGCAQQSAQRRDPLLALSPMLTIPPVFAKSCLRGEGCNDAGTEKETVDNFGQMALFAQPVVDDCCGYHRPHVNKPVVQHAQAAKKKNPSQLTEPAAASTSVQLTGSEPWYKTLYYLMSSKEIAVTPTPLAKSAITPVAAAAVPVATMSAGNTVATRAAVTTMTQVWGQVTLTEGTLAASSTVPLLGVLFAAFYSQSVGEGSDKVPGRDEHWLEDTLRQKGWAGETATTRVRFFWRSDIHGKMQVYGVHTGEGTPYEGVRVANMVWKPEQSRYEFTPAPGVDGPKITWTPANPEGSEPISQTETPVAPIDQPTILVHPIPDSAEETTTPPFPMPDEQDFNDWILVFPADSGIKPIYVYLKSTARDEPGVVTGQGEVLTGEGKWLESASSELGAPIPAQVADKLRGRTFGSFDRFREAFWMEVANDSDLSSQFNTLNIERMKHGKAPRTIKSEHAGKRKSFELHHVEHIAKGGDTYDIDNIRVATPKRHINIHREQ
ncbi:S-type Pyocin [Lonsdalea britannica]|uniref:S-type pyocin domain-containing protein n=1 Tax=Lonsdalea britannica TaxID=1082704 RepID=UPI000A1F19C3|nr:S-type pyocin domain-containing protein [Lonsdalea britannica]OSN02506.1 S-type Pyocin [Lonsdalea britannica]